MIKLYLLLICFNCLHGAEALDCSLSEKEIALTGLTELLQNVEKEHNKFKERLTRLARPGVRSDSWQNYDNDERNFYWQVNAKLKEAGCIVNHLIPLHLQLDKRLQKKDDKQFDWDDYVEKRQKLFFFYLETLKLHMDAIKSR